MRAPLIAIGLDAFEPSLLEEWVAAGKLPFFRRMFEQSVYARQRNFELYRTENSWLTLLQGCTPDVSREWGHQIYTAGEYRIKENAAYEFRNQLPFYALGPDRRVAIFDVPLTDLVEGVNGIQLLGWGTEVNQILRQSSPPDLMKTLIQRHGRHPLYDTITNADDGTETLSYRIPSVYDLSTLREVRDQLLVAVRRRSAIIADLMAAEAWDLLLCVYGEIHTAGHIFWHLSRDHPLSALRSAAGSDFLLEIVQEVDRCLEALVERAPPEASIVLFSPHGMQGNSLDLYSMMFLPELLYRWSTGHSAFHGDRADEGAPAPRLDYSRHWRDEVWDLRTGHGNEALEAPTTQTARDDPLDWDPGNWYRPLWPGMKAFVLPGYSEGLVRLNVRGRDGPSGILPGEFEGVIAELTELISDLRDARTGKPLAREVRRVRTDPFEVSDDLPPADLMVIWCDDICTDVADHPKLGRIGPVPYFRSGGHSCQGFFLGKGAGLSAGDQRGDIDTRDVTATFLDMLGSAPPEGLSGRSIWQYPLN